MKLSKKEKQIVKKAMEIIENDPIWSCWALYEAETGSYFDVKNTKLLLKYIKFFNVQKDENQNIWPDLYEYKGHKEERLMMLAMFLEAHNHV